MISIAFNTSASLLVVKVVSSVPVSPVASYSIAPFDSNDANCFCLYFDAHDPFPAGLVVEFWGSLFVHDMPVPPHARISTTWCDPAARWNMLD